MKTQDLSIRNTADLRSLLIDTIEGVTRGDTDCRTGATVAKIAGTILQSARLDLEYLKFFQNADVIAAKSKSLPLLEENGTSAALPETTKRKTRKPS